MERFWSKVAKGDGCWEWMAARDRKGYGMFQVGVGKTARAPRFAWELAHGPIPAGLHVLHRCDNPSCVRPDHLFLGTAADNNADKVAKGRQARGDRHPSRTHRHRLPRGDQHHLRLRPETVLRGEQNGNARLTSEQVRDILAMRASGKGQRAVAATFGVSKTTIRRIERGLTWRHVHDAK